MKKQEIYVSVDIEADGPIPGPHSMLSLGAAAYTEDKKLLDTFSVNLELLPGAEPDPGTMKFWEKHPEAWEKTRKDPQAPAEAMKTFDKWVRSLPGRPVMVAYPAGFDFTFVYWYLVKFVGKSPFGFSALDIKTYAMALLKTKFRKVGKRSMPKEWFDPHEHTHVAVEDAIEQGALFCNMLAYNR